RDRPRTARVLAAAVLDLSRRRRSHARRSALRAPRRDTARERSAAALTRRGYSEGGCAGEGGQAGRGGEDPARARAEDAGESARESRGSGRATGVDGRRRTGLRIED